MIETASVAREMPWGLDSRVERLEIRAVGDRDAAAVAAAEVCACRASASRPMWQWLYCQNPCGRRALVAVDGGRVVGHFGGFPVRFRTGNGAVRTAVHVIQTFVVPGWRTGRERRPGVFAVLGETATRLWGERNGDLLLYGFPPSHAQRAGARYLGYDALRPVEFLVRDFATPLRPAVRHPRAVVVDRLPGPDQLDAASRAPRTVGVVRDAEWLRWRYAQHPEGVYAFASVLLDDRLTGYCVWRCRHDLIAPGAAAIAELWLAEHCDVDAGAALLAHVEQRAAAAGRRGALAICAPNDGRLMACFARAGYAPSPDFEGRPRYLTHRITRQGHHHTSRTQLHDHWRYHLGDSDLV